MNIDNTFGMNELFSVKALPSSGSMDIKPGAEAVDQSRDETGGAQFDQTVSEMMAAKSSQGNTGAPSAQSAGSPPGDAGQGAAFSAGQAPVATGKSVPAEFAADKKSDIKKDARKEKDQPRTGNDAFLFLSAAVPEALLSTAKQAAKDTKDHQAETGPAEAAAALKNASPGAGRVKGSQPDVKASEAGAGGPVKSHSSTNTQPQKQNIAATQSKVADHEDIAAIQDSAAAPLKAASVKVIPPAEAPTREATPREATPLVAATREATPLVAAPREATPREAKGNPAEAVGAAQEDAGLKALAKGGDGGQSGAGIENQNQSAGVGRPTGRFEFGVQYRAPYGQADRFSHPGSGQQQPLRLSLTGKAESQAPEQLSGQAQDHSIQPARLPGQSAGQPQGQPAVQTAVQTAAQTGLQSGLQSGFHGAGNSGGPNSADRPAPAGAHADESFVVTRQDAKSIEVRIEPEGLGKMDIRLVLGGGRVNAHISASELMGKQAVEGNLRSIITKLADDGINVGSFSVSLRNGKREKQWREGEGRSNAASKVEKTGGPRERPVQEAQTGRVPAAAGGAGAGLLSLFA